MLNCLRLFDDAIDTEAEPVQIPTVAPQPQRNIVEAEKRANPLRTVRSNHVEQRHFTQGEGGVQDLFLEFVKPQVTSWSERQTLVALVLFPPPKPRVRYGNKQPKQRRKPRPSPPIALSRTRRSPSAEETERLRQRSEQLLAAAANFKPLKKTRWNPFHLEIYEPAATTMASRFLDWMRNDSVAKHPPIGFQTLVKHVALQSA